MTHPAPSTAAPLLVGELASPVGRLTIVVGAGRLRSVRFEAPPVSDDALARRFGATAVVHEPDPGGVASRLARYFDGALDALDDIDVAPAGTPFQLAVWRALRRIPPGDTAAYRDVARAIGAPDAVRAVGAANGANPIAIVVPCHRVVGADGSLTGYAGGLDRKRWLLAHEAGARPLRLTAPA